MTWVRFGPGETPIPDALLTDPTGKVLSPAAFRGQSNLLLFLAHDPACVACQESLTAFASRRDELRQLETAVLVVWPGTAPARPSPGEGWYEAADPRGELRRRLAGLLAFDTTAKPLLFVLDRHGVPYVAWVAEPLPQVDLPRETLAWLEYIAIQCPE
ncbi:MAG: hypothetical protein RMN24_04825 [Anaerolineae bacterium]|nr:hypothetical protein [Caldilineales bacterium]MCX7852928.1 hypothetical protein [Caldilineales bacterium]MDW8268470.1 hypothetical protein [Anaerolineae bacterium]